MDIENILHKYDEMAASGQMQEAVEYLENMAAECVEEGKNTSAITIFNELEGFWRVAGEKENSYAAAEAALGLISSGQMEGSIGHATTLLNYATAKTAFGALYVRIDVVFRSRQYKSLQV